MRFEKLAEDISKEWDEQQKAKKYATKGNGMGSSSFQLKRLMILKKVETKKHLKNRDIRNLKAGRTAICGG